MQSQHRVLIAVLLLAAGIFVIDLEVPLGVAGGVPYVAVVLLALWSPDPRMPLYAAVGCSILTMLAVSYSPRGVASAIVIANRALAVFAIWVTAILSVRWRSAQRRMSQQQKRIDRVSRVNTMGEMASGIAHELNQPLSTILNYAEASLLAVKAGKLDRDALLQDLEAITDAAERSGAIVRHLRDLIANPKIERSPQNLNRLIRETLEFMNRDIERSGVILHLELRPALPSVVADAIQIQQVVVNLIRNAIEAMSETADKSLTIRSSVDDAGNVEVMFTDTGSGLGDIPIDSIFEHFVSSKRDGLGVGLAISRSIIEAHLGHLAVEGNPGGGMTFRFIVPAASRHQSGEAGRVGS
jgi:C4-dicarboxylate-specific signal transduction histidine kinase